MSSLWGSSASDNVYGWTTISMEMVCIYVCLYIDIYIYVHYMFTLLQYAVALREDSSYNIMDEMCSRFVFVIKIISCPYPLEQKLGCELQTKDYHSKFLAI